MGDTPYFPLRVFYDGSCIVCAAEIEHYMSKDHGGRLQAVDISAMDFNPEPLGMSLSALMYELHAIDSNGRIYRGVEAFRAIWQAFPSSTAYGFLAAVIAMPLINPLARLFYKGFARIRPYLPKSHSCNSGTCRINKKRQ